MAAGAQERQIRQCTTLKLRIKTLMFSLSTTGGWHRLQIGDKSKLLRAAAERDAVPDASTMCSANSRRMKTRDLNRRRRDHKAATYAD